MSTELKVILIECTPNPEKIVSSAAKLCYSPASIPEIMDGLTSEEIERFINRLAKMGHESPFEHINFTFGIEGVSRSLTHQLVRHRIGASYSQQSQRYVKEKQFEYVVPVEIAKYPSLKSAYAEMMERAQEDYDIIVDGLLYEYFSEYLSEHDNDFYEEYWKGSQNVIFSDESLHDNELFNKIVPEKMSKKKYNELEKTAIENARYILPNACETKIVVTMNARALFNFFALRCCERAQQEIRMLAIEMLKLVKEEAPNIFKYCGPSCVSGSCTEGSMSCGKAQETKQFFLGL